MYPDDFEDYAEGEMRLHKFEHWLWNKAVWWQFIPVAVGCVLLAAAVVVFVVMSLYVIAG